MNFSDLGIIVRDNGRAEQRVRCPNCGKGERDDTLGVNCETGVFNCFRCGYKGCARGQSVATAPAGPRTDRRDDPADIKRRAKKLNAIWRGTSALTDPAAAPVRKYLERRGLGQCLETSPDVLRAHTGITYFEEGRAVGEYPAMVALLTDKQGKGATLHITYLRPDGTKAPVGQPKKLMPCPRAGATKGGAIQLHQPVDGVLGIAEGIETALSLHTLYSVAVWSASCADSLKRVSLPPGLRQLWIGVDLDENGKGESCARALAARVSDWMDVKLVYPTGCTPADLNDELLTAQVH